MIWWGVTHYVRPWWLWPRWLCRRGWHIFNEVRTSERIGWVHYLHCDRCGLSLAIDDAWSARLTEENQERWRKESSAEPATTAAATT